jgi:hypothetical protein
LVSYSANAKASERKVEEKQMEKRRENNAARQKKAAREKKRREGRRAREGGKWKERRRSLRFFPLPALPRAPPFFSRTALFSRAAFSSDREIIFIINNELNEIILKRRLGSSSSSLLIIHKLQFTN